VAGLGGLWSGHQEDEGNKEYECEQRRSPHEEASEAVEDSEHENREGDQPIVEDSRLEYRNIVDEIPVEPYQYATPTAVTTAPKSLTNKRSSGVGTPSRRKTDMGARRAGRPHASRVRATLTARICLSQLSF